MFMYETIKRIYKNTGNPDAVTRAKDKGWITPDEAAEILGTATAPGYSPE